MASNFAKLAILSVFMEYSCLKSFGIKHKTTIARAKSDRRTGKRWGAPYKTKADTKMILKFAFQDK